MPLSDVSLGTSFGKQAELLSLFNYANRPKCRCSSIRLPFLVSWSSCRVLLLYKDEGTTDTKIHMDVGRSVLPPPRVALFVHIIVGNQTKRTYKDVLRSTIKKPNTGLLKRIQLTPRTSRKLNHKI